MEHYCTMAGESYLAMEQRFGLIDAENQKLQQQEERPRQLCEEIQRMQTPKIQKVAHYLRDRQDFTHHYLPKLVSFGPIHHGEAKLQLGEQYKLMWLAMYVKGTGQNARDLHKRIADNIKKLKDLFDKDLFANKDEYANYKCQGFQSLDEKLSWILFVDGCSLLQILDKGNTGKDYDYRELNVKIDQFILLQQDVLLLENQLPYLVLKLLSCHETAEAKLLEIMDKFLRTHHLWPESCVSSTDEKKEKEPQSEGSTGSKKDNLQKESKVVLQPPAHLLDHLRRAILGDCCPKTDRKRSKCGISRRISGNICRNKDREVSDSRVITHRNIQELKASGIKLMKIKSRRPKDIDFSDGKLMLPYITVDDTTATTFHNLIAYEMCPDFQNDYGISSFVAFLESLIDHPEDVKQLRSAGILLNGLGSDEEVSTLFNNISTDLVPNVGTYSNVRNAIEERYTNKIKTGMNEYFHTYFRHPWSVTKVLAALVAFGLTITQTVYSIKGS